MDHPGGQSGSRGGLSLSTDFCSRLSFHQCSLLICRECFFFFFHILERSACHRSIILCTGILSPFLTCSLTSFHWRVLKCQPSASMNALQLLQMFLGLQQCSSLSTDKFSLKVVLQFLQTKWVSLNFLLFCCPWRWYQNCFNVLFLLKCKTRLFPYIWCLNMSGHLKFVYEPQNCTTPNQMLWNRAKPRPASPNHHVRYVIVWDIKQLGVVMNSDCSDHRHGKKI